MSYDLHSSRYEPSRLHNPWEQFAHRDEKKHQAENDLVFRLGRPPFQLVPIAPPHTLSTRSTAEVIDLFLQYGSKRLDDQVPRKQQLLKDFLRGSDPPLSALSSSTPPVTYIDDVKLRSSVGDIALIDDRNNHSDCGRKIKKACSDCHIYSKKLSIPDLCTRLQGEVSSTIGMFRSDIILT
jgi:hypothetical protein